jgi:uncharacterized protein
MPKKIELRANRVKEIRATGETDNQAVEGYGIVYDEEIELFPGFFEKIARGAFKRSALKADVIKSYFNHDSASVLSTTQSTPPLSLRDDDKGLYYISPIPPTTYGEDLKINLKRNNVSGSSFAFTVTDEDWEERKDGTIHRNIKEGEIYEIGPVTDPAYVQTGASLHSTKEMYESRKKGGGVGVTTTEEPTPPPKSKKSENVLNYEMLKLNLEKEIL